MKFTEEEYERHETEYLKRLNWTVKRLHEGSPLESVPLDRLRMLLDDALRASGFDDLTVMLEVNRAEAENARKREAEWRARAARADDRDVCEHCGATENLTRSAVSCTPCLAKLFTRK